MLVCQKVTCNRKILNSDVVTDHPITRYHIIILTMIYLVLTFPISPEEPEVLFRTVAGHL